MDADRLSACDGKTVQMEPPTCSGIAVAVMDRKHATTVSEPRRWNISTPL